MRAVCAVLLVLVTFGADVAADDAEPIRAGRSVIRVTRGGVDYAVYATSRWRKKKPAPLLIHIPMERITPRKVVAAAYVLQEMEAAADRHKLPALHCPILLEAHNKENAHSQETIDLERYRVLLARDVGAVAEVIEAVATEASVDRDAVFLLGTRYAAEEAIGIAARRPDLFAAVLAKETETSTMANPVGAPEQQTWTVLPEGDVLKRALDLPVVLAFDPGEPNGDVRQQTANRLQGFVESAGFRRVAQVPGVPDDSYRQFVSPEMYAWIAARVAERHLQAEKRTARDKLLAEGRRYAAKGNLSSALTRYRKAAALETEHALDVTTTDLYDVLVGQARAELDAAHALAPAKRASAYKKMVRLFAGTPFGEEVKGLLEAER